MENGALIGALAIFTIGAALVGAILYFGYFLKDPKNREHAHRTLVRDEGSAATSQEHTGGMAPIQQRLDHSDASSHPADPQQAKSRA